MVLALGGVAFLAGCGADDRAHGAWPQQQDPPVDQHPPAEVPAGPGANPPAAGVCPAIPGAGTPHPGGPQYYLPCQGTEISLTIDDGPDPTYTPKVLALLAKHHVTATFCMIGRSAASHPGLVRQVIDGGHHIANHTFTHPLNLDKFPAAKVRGELGKAADAIAKASGGQRPTLFRAPGGAWSPTILGQCRQLGLRPLDWSVDPRDWSRPGVQHIVDTILTRTHPGAIILDHDGGGNRDQTVTALGIALPRLLDAGYTFAQP
jgi:peptidoglycan/xylan/chitin deacetylase (PgdA/CDA1 family)